MDLELIKQNNVLSKPAFFLLLPNHFTTNIKACSFLTLGSLIIPDGPTFRLARPQQTLLGSAALHCSPQTLSWGNTAHLKREHELWERGGVCFRSTKAPLSCQLYMALGAGYTLDIVRALGKSPPSPARCCDQNQYPQIKWEVGSFQVPLDLRVKLIINISN